MEGKRYEVLDVGTRALDRETDHLLVIICNYSDDVVVDATIDRVRRVVHEVAEERYQPPLTPSEQNQALQRLTGHADSLPSALSSGQLQAMLLASALLRPRDLLVLDEPEQRLDPRARGRLADVLRAESDKGVAVLFVTHQPELARVAHHVIALDDGAVVADGSPDEVLTVAGA